MSNDRRRPTRQNTAANQIVQDFRQTTAKPKPPFSVWFAFSVAALFLLPIGVAVALNLELTERPSAPPKVQRAFDMMKYEEPKAVAKDFNIERPLPEYFGMAMYTKLSFNNTKTGLDAIDSELHGRCLNKIDTNAATLAAATGKASLYPTNAHRFLTCSARVQKTRFCNPYYRKRFAKSVLEYLRSVKALRRNVSKMLLLTSMQASLPEGFEPEDQMSVVPIEERRLLKKPITSSLAKEMRSLSAMGLLRSSDFSNWFVSPPEEISDLLLDVVSPC